MQNYCPKFLHIKTKGILSLRKYSVLNELVKARSTNVDDIIDPKVKAVKDKLLYSDYLNKKKLRRGYKENNRLKYNLEYKFEKEKLNEKPVSSALKYLDKNLIKNFEVENNLKENEEVEQKQKPIHMPYASVDSYQNVSLNKDETSELNEDVISLYENYLDENKNISKELINDFINDRDKIFTSDNSVKKNSLIPSHWMTDYEEYDDALINDQENVTYGTPNPNTEVSSIPCGGCGALLHCKDAALPGYLPSELFSNKTDDELKSLICQRCHFMKNYNTCLDVKVSADEYPKLLKEIKNNPKALVLVLVDLTDFPCSIWPKLPSLIGNTRYVFVIGNKIDLLPRDSKNFLENVKDCLKESMIQNGLAKANIKHISLISAKTGYGIEDLITKLYQLWNYRSDIYLVGCTNSGKSTLFNALINSDMCKSQAVDLIQRATTAVWPGTTLSLLKFPLLKPNGPRRLERHLRLVQDKNKDYVETLEKLETYTKTNKIDVITLQSRISHTFKQIKDRETLADQLEKQDYPTLDKPIKCGLDETSEEFKNSKWCYDTPGTIQPDQILHLLTTDELIKTLPDKIISPKTFCVWPSQTIFIAGLGRLDILKSNSYIRCTVFASNFLPVTICEIENAEIVYNELLKSEAFVVPTNDPGRLKVWPELKSKNLETKGIGKNESSADVVLSSAGWIAITALEGETIQMRAWTPEGRGIYLRTPALLPKSVTLRGMRQVGSPAYRLGQQIYIGNKR